MFERPKAHSHLSNMLRRRKLFSPFSILADRLKGGKRRDASYSKNDNHLCASYNVNIVHFMNKFSQIISNEDKPALFIGNGINLFESSDALSWQKLLDKLAHKHGLKLTRGEVAEMSNTEFFDILDLAKPIEDKSSLQKQFSELMAEWRPSKHHEIIVKWAQRHRRPIVTVNFDENLSRSIDAKFFRGMDRFTDYYPWSSYFSDQKLETPHDDFAIWHAHGMQRYSRSIRLGLTHYMGSVQRTRSWVNGPRGLRKHVKNGGTSWRGDTSWIDVVFKSHLVIFGFTFSKDETFLRWLFLERARFQKSNPTWKLKTWFVDTPQNGSLHRKPFFEGLGMQYVSIEEYSDIYDCPSWQS